MSEPNANVFMSEEVREVVRLHDDLLTEEFCRLPIRDQLDRQAQRIAEAHMAGDEAVATHITCWHPEMVGHSVEAIMSRECTLDDARQTIAREYGFTNWSEVENLRTQTPDSEFESAVNAILDGNVEALRELLERDGSLIHQRSRFGHQSTLLHYVGSNGVETYRQKVPMNLAEVTQVLVDAGADVNSTAEMYGGGSTTIALLITSGHPAEAGVVDDVVEVLLKAGAETD